ncbi:klarsicht protein isoform X2 [Malaya genurostris]|uniref:klarsicht protein isoform X2 n=1 Tax=Malaya genurostris TaxID=325434 RepID=UPI0026F3D2A0|nr:klarsicht protein isoform X2 [Malaya genurostris]
MKPPTGEEKPRTSKQQNDGIPTTPTSAPGLGSSPMASISTQTHTHGSGSSRMNPPAMTANASSSANSSPGCFIKPSLSLNSLPPQGPPEGSEMAQNRLRIDRPYNSLKKKRDSERELWRRSWGSGHSHSSCSLQSSTTTGIGKDDFWAALQTNYNFIMDTNLLDSCREARGEIEGPVIRAEEDDVDCYRKAMYNPSPMQTFYGDPRLLRQWIKEMETRLSRVSSSSVTEIKKMKMEQLLRLSGEHSEIYREIKSNSRAVAACVRAYEKKSAKASKFSGNISGVNSVASSSTATTAGNSSSSTGPPSGSGSLIPEVDAQPSTSAVYFQPTTHRKPTDRSFPEEKLTAVKLSSKAKENSIVKGLQRRYLLLYLKAFEFQLLLEGLLDSKTSSSDNNASLSDTDEEPVNKLARLSNSNKSKSPGSPQNECLSDEEWVNAKKLSNAGFDADSEGSDCEIVPKIINYHTLQHVNPCSPATTTSVTTHTPSTPSSPPSATNPLLPEVATASPMMMMETDIGNLSTNTIVTIASTNTTTASTTTTLVTGAPASGKLFSEDLIDGIIREANAQDLINNNRDNHSATNEITNQLRGKTSSPKQSGKQKRTKPNDLSKFNRSTRKSKNCATFYFKHLDTDSELNKDSSERAKSDETSSSSEGDEWVYNNGDEGAQEGGESSPDSSGSDPAAVRSSGGQVIPLGDEDEKENKPHGGGGGGEDNKPDGTKLTGSGTAGPTLTTTGKELKSKKCLDFSPDALAGINLSSRALMMTSIGSFGKSSDSVDSGGRGSAIITSKQQQYATSSIQRLVLHAETLVRDEIFAKTPKTVVKNPHYHHHHHHHHNHRNYHNQTYQQQQHQGGGGGSGPHQLHSSSASRLHATLTGIGGVSSHNSVVVNSSGNRKVEKVMSNHKINRIEEWLEKQPLDVAATAPLLPGSGPTTDCEASGEYTDSDSITRDTDSSEGLANSVATCLQGDQTSQELLTDNVYPSETSIVSNDEVESKNNSTSNASLQVKRRVNKPSGERPWSVSCISQLNTSAVEINQYGERLEKHQNQRLLTASFSISESALNTMSAMRSSLKSTPGTGAGATMATSSSGGGSQQPLMTKSTDSKGSLKKRKLRSRRKNRIDESGSDESQPPTQQSSALHLLQHSLILQHQQQLLQQQQLQQQQLQQPLREIQLSAGSSSGSGRQQHYLSNSSHRGSLLKSESFSGRIRLSDDLVTLSSLSGSSGSRKSFSARQTTRGTTMTTTLMATVSTKKSTADSEEEQQQSAALMAKPNFKIGSSVTRARCGSVNLGSLAALANYNLDGVERAETDQNGTGTGTEEMSSFSEQAWDNYQEKYMSEPYSEDRDTDAARRLLDFGDDYRNFIDSQSDCASSSLSAANMDSLSPPRLRKNDPLGKSSEPNANSLNRRKRLDEYRMDDRYSHNMHSWSSKSGSPPHHSLEKTMTVRGKHHVLYESPDQSGSGGGGGGAGGGGGSGLTGGNGRRRSLRSVDKHNTFLRSLSHETSSSSNNEFDEDMEAEVKKLLIQSKLRFANTEALKAKSHLLKPEDYDEIIKTCRENVRCLETVLLSQPGTVLTAAKCQDLRDTVLCWENLLSWSERRQVTTRFQSEILSQKDVLEDLGCKAFDFSSEAHIQLAIDQLKNERKVLQNQRPKMLTLNATVHSWVSAQELQRKELLDETSIEAQLEQFERDKNFSKCADQKCGACYDCLNELREDCSINRELKEGINQLYSTWDEAEVRIRNRIENLTSSMMTWKQLEDGLSDFKDILDRDRGKLQGIEGALQSGAGRTDEMVNSVKEVVKALSENVEPLFQEHNVSIPVNLKLSSSGSLSDSGISDGGGMSDGSLSEREKRLSALKRLVKQLEVALAPGSEAMQTITKRLEMAEHDLRSLQNTCRKIIMNEKDGPSRNGDIDQHDEGSNFSNNNDSSVKNKNKNKHGSKKNRNSSPGKSRLQPSLAETDSEENHLYQEVQKEALGEQQQRARDQQEHFQRTAATAQLGLIQTTKLKLSQNRWVWRITKIAVPVQLALVLVMCAACFFEPHCCDALNTYSMSFTPQLRYIKGPPPV